MEKNNFSKNLKASKILLVKDVESNCINQIEEKIGNKNVATFYHIACIFNYTELSKLSLCHIERLFPLVCENINFKKLDFDLIAKIISSSELNTDSEIEVFNAADNWIAHDFEERRKFASRLLAKVRLNLLSVDALNCILESNVSISKIDDCVAILKNVLKNNKSSLKNKLSRYWSQDMYKIILSGGYKNQTSFSNVSDVTKQIDVKNLNNMKNIDPLKIKRATHRSVYCRAAVYVFGGLDENKQPIKSIEKYSFATNRWYIVGEMFDYRRGFDVCRFMDHLLIFGGCDNTLNPFYSCKNFMTVLYYDAEKDEWSEEKFNLTKDKTLFSCTFIPHMKI